MKTVIASLGLTLCALPAAAHNGAHLHPHGAEIGLPALAFALAAIAAAGVAIYRRR